MSNGNELSAILNKHFLDVLSNDVANNSLEGMADYNGIITGIAVAMYEHITPDLQASVMNALTVHGIDIHDHLSDNELLEVLGVTQEETKKYDKVNYTKEGNVYTFPTPETKQ